MAEERARRFSQAFGSSGLSDETLEQAYDDVAQLTFDYQRRPITDLVGNLSRTQEAVFSLLEERQRPAQARQLFFLGGVVSGVLAKACHDFMNPYGAMVHARTAFLCADQADHDALRAWTRGLESQISYWAGRPHDALRYAQSGATFAANTTSSMSVWLPASEARAWAVLGNASEAIAAIQRAESGAGRRTARRTRRTGRAVHLPPRSPAVLRRGCARLALQRSGTSRGLRQPRRPSVRRRERSRVGLRRPSR